MIALIAQRAYSHETAVPVSLTCAAVAEAELETALLSDATYLVSDRYGWFDKTHFNTGRPAKVLEDVAAAIDTGGGIVTIRQGVREDLTGYTATYRISGELEPADAIAAALGIYLDWSYRFEAWQAELPHALFGPLTPFAVEDLPSQYLGFYAQANEMSVEEIFACYLGPVSVSEEGPPDFVVDTEDAEVDSWSGIQRLQNNTFMPMVKTENGWEHVDWPQPMRMALIPGSHNTWEFLTATTWYLGTGDGLGVPFSDTYSHRYPDLLSGYESNSDLELR